MPTPIFDIPTFVKNHLPPNYRLPKWLSSIQSLLSGLTWRKVVFDAYQSGDDKAIYDPTETYGAGNSVQYNFATYESLIDGNMGNIPSQSPDAWTLRCNSFIGASERVTYDGKYLKLTYALNRAYRTEFRQPPYPDPYGGSGTFSDIYITTDIIVYTTFLVAKTNGDTVGKSKSSGFVTETEIFDSASSYSFTIHIPTAVYNDLGATNPIRESIVRRFADQYVPIGIKYSIVTY